MHYSARSSDLEAITHELGHCLGLVHEHQRPDRDEFIDIIWDKIIQGKKFNFEIMDNPLYLEQSFEYDYKSIMHYPPVSFSLDGSPTIISIPPDIEINSNGISDVDAQKATAIYGLPFEEDDVFE